MLQQPAGPPMSWCPDMLGMVVQPIRPLYACLRQLGVVVIGGPPAAPLLATEDVGGDAKPLRHKRSRK